MRFCGYNQERLIGNVDTRHSLHHRCVSIFFCRNHLKGRDWYDFIWYTARRAPINHALLSAALDQQGPWKGQAPHTDNEWCVAHLGAMIAEHDWMQARRDVQRFIKPHELPSLELWSRDYFLRLCAKLSDSGSPR
jgi:hypothetical protein